MDPVLSKTGAIKKLLVLVGGSLPATFGEDQIDHC